MRGMDMLNSAREKVNQSSPARERLALLFDQDSFVELDAFAKVNGEEAGVVTGYGTIEGGAAFAFAQDPSVAGGGVGRVHAAKIRKLYDLAVKTGAPVIGIYDSKGARVDEGMDALSAYGEMLVSANSLSGVVPQISIIAGVCGGTAAMVAASADFIVMYKEAELFLHAPKEGKADGEAAAQSGTAHLVTDSVEESISTVRRMISMLPSNNLDTPPMFEFTAPAGESLDAAAENLDDTCPCAILDDILDVDSSISFQKDFGKAAVTRLATLGGNACGVVSVKGELDKDACAKVARFVSVCDAFQLPVLTFVNATGFKGCELSGLAREAAKLAHVYAEATTSKISVVTGAAYGPVYIALAGKNAGADVVYAWPSAVISPLAPETAVAFMEGDKITADKTRSQVEEEYKRSEASAFAAAAAGVIEEVIAPSATRQALIRAVDMLAGKRVSRLPKKHSNMPL